MHIEGDLNVFLGAILIWCGALKYVDEALSALEERRWISVLWSALTTLGAVLIGLAVWGAA